MRLPWIVLQDLQEYINVNVSQNIFLYGNGKFELNKMYINFKV